jgi:succinyl-diaminopimelate desuccinylase
MPVDPVVLTTELIRCPSVTPAAEEALELVEARLDALGFICHRLTFDERGSYPVPNLYARLGEGAPSLLFAGHVDVVPPGDSARWSVDPFGGVIQDGKIWGRGAADMKSGVACFIAAVSRHLQRHGLPLGSVALLVTGDEEAESVNGTDAVLDWAVDRGEHWDGALVGEPTCPSQLGDVAKIGRRGSLSGKLTVRGRQGHTAYPQRADSAAHRMVQVLSRLLAEPLDEGTEAFEPSNLQVTSIDIGNPAVNVIPGEARATFNIRFNDRHTQASLEAHLRRTIAALAPDFTLEVAGNAEAFRTELGRLTAILAEAVKTVTGRIPAFNTFGGTSDARFIRRCCPVVEFGLVGTTMHQFDECVAVADVEGLTLIYEEFLKRYFNAA